MLKYLLARLFQQAKRKRTESVFRAGRKTETCEGAFSLRKTENGRIKNGEIGRLDKKAFCRGT